MAVGVGNEIRLPQKAPEIFRYWTSAFGIIRSLSSEFRMNVPHVHETRLPTRLEERSVAITFIVKSCNGVMMVMKMMMIMQFCSSVLHISEKDFSHPPLDAREFKELSVTLTVWPWARALAHYFGLTNVTNAVHLTSDDIKH